MTSRIFAPQNFALKVGRSALVLAAMAAVGSAGAEAGSAARFKAYDGPPKQLDGSRLLGARADRPVQMLVVLSERSIAAARAQSATRRISAADRDAVVRRVEAQHASMRPLLETRGAKVLNLFHSAVNGIKVEVRPSQIAALKALPGVVSVLPVLTHERNNATSVPYIGAPLVWEGLPGLAGLRGEGVKVAIVDTGIDYTHANFGGPGTTQAFQAAAATSTAPADPALFGPGAPKVKGGTDLVGDAYNANDPNSVPVPDPNPLDCNGHGSHVAGTAAGFGVTGAGATYHGPYNSAIYTPGAFIIGPGVAPAADLYSVRVFGCTGSTNVVVDAIDWAVANDMNVISMSLGANFGPADSADALASAAAAQAGIVVVAASGNAGPAPYITSSPASGDGVISVAAIDGRPSFPGATMALSTGQSISAQDSNGAPLPAAPMPVLVLRNADGSISLGCSQSEYTGTAGKLVVAMRGNCARTDRAKFGQAAGATAVVLINNSVGYPPYEGPITGVTIPFLGIQSGSDATALVASSSASLSAITLDNPFVGTVASFSSGGPRLGDSIFKPALSAPGVSVFSTLSGSGNQGIYLSGTSMATPHVAGVAALAIQAHTGWSGAEISTAIVETAAPSKLPDYKARLEGAGLVQPASTALNQAVVSVDGVPAAAAVSFGFAEFARDYNGARVLHIANKGTGRMSFNVSSAPTAGSPHTLHLSRSVVSVASGSTVDIVARLSVPVVTAGGTHDAGGNLLFNEVAGLITLTPTSTAMNGGIALQLPYYLVPRGRSEMISTVGGLKPGLINVNLSNRFSQVAANADFYALGLEGTRQSAAPFDMRAIGVQSFPIDGSANLLVFAVNTFDRFSTAAAAEVDVYIDTNGDGIYDYVVLTLLKLTAV